MVLCMDDELKIQNNPNIFRKMSLSDADYLLQLYTKFPSLVSINMKCTKFRWLRKLGNISMIIHLEAPSFPSSRNVQIVGDEQFMFVMENCEIDVGSLNESTETLEDVLDNIDKHLRNIETDRGLSKSEIKTDSIKQIENIIEEINKIGHENVVDISEGLTSVTLKSPDDDQDDQELILHIPPDYPLSPVTPVHLLPSSYPLATSCSLVQIYRSWTEALEHLTPTWRHLAELDRLCWILDPVPPSSIHLYRRLVLTPAVSLHLELDPASPSSMPTLRFLGSDQKIGPIREHLAEHTELWDDDDPVHYNLERVLGLELPSKDDTAGASQSGGGWNVECGICYNYKLDDKLPTVSCQDEKCCQSYHPSCLYEWLINLPGCRTSLNMVTGECPYCSQPLQCAKPVDNQYS